MKLWHKFSLALIAIGLVPLLITTWQLVGNDIEELKQSARAYHIATADQALEAARSLIAKSIAETTAIGAALAQPDTDVDDRIRAARAQLIGARVVDLAAVYNPEGAQIDVMRAPRDDGMDARLDAPEILGEDTRRIALAEGYLTGDVTKSADGRPVMPLIVPIKRGVERELYVYLWTSIDLAPLSDGVAELSRRRFGGRPDRVELLDERVRIIASDDAARVWTDLAGREAVAGIDASAGAFKRDVAQTLEYVDHTGEEVIGAVVPLPELHWAVTVVQSREQAYAAVARTWRTALIIGSIVALAALILGILLARRLAAPVVNVATSAKKVAAGDFSVRVQPKGRDEVAEMGHSFNDMARDLGDYRDKLIEETRVRGNLSRFLSPEVVEQVVDHQDALMLGGERRQITVLFADVVSFTTLADEHEPEFVVSILNELFTIITEIVFKHGGIIDKFIGDCAMAIWGAPKAHDDDALRAVRAAEEMLRWLEVGNAKWKKELGRELELAIGINTGEVVVGNIGSEKRMEYTAIGDVVNVAARLERLARPGQILMTRSVMNAVGEEFDSLSLGTYNLVGRARPSEIFVLDE